MAEMQSTEKSSEALNSELKTANVGNLRRKSTGDAIMKPASSPVSSEGKVVSRYLRASTSSCHDFCKYGGRHAFESKEEFPVSLLFRKKRSAGKQKHKKDASSGKDIKQKSDAKFMKSAPELETGSSLKMVCDSSQRDLMENSPVVSDSVQNNLMDNFHVAGCPGDSGDTADKLMTRTVLETIDDKEAKQSGSSSPFESPALGNGTLRLQKHRSKMRAASKTPEAVQSPQKQVLDSKQELSTESAFPNVSRNLGGVVDGGTKLKDIEVSENKEIKEAKINFLSSQVQDRGAAGLKSKKDKVKNPSSARKHESHSKALLASKRKPLATKASSPSQSLLSSKRKPLATKAPLSNLSNNSGGIANGHKKANDAAQVKGKREVRSSAPSSFKSPALRVTQPGSKKQHKNNSPSPSPLVNGGSGLKPTKYLEKKHPVPDKKTRTGILSTVDGSCTETENKIVNIGDLCDSEPKKLSPELSPASAPPSSPLSSSLTSLEEDQESQFTGDSHEDVGFETENGAKISNQEKQGPTRGVLVQTQDKGHVPHKLTFRSGNLMGNQSERDGPRRLKFKQGRMIENKDGRDEGRRRTFRKKGSPLANNARNAGDVGPAVVLRHQDIQAKKYAQDFNQVIEETANKLVESRKSKVKALVGAFETVISLQEAKPVVS